MSIYYTLITKSDKVISENTEYVGNFEQISRELIRNIKVNTRGCLSFDDMYKFFYINNDNINYLCMCDNNYDKTQAFLFLEKISDLLINTFTEKDLNEAISYSLDQTFKPLIHTTMLQYNNNCIDNSDKVALLSKAVTDMKEAVIDNSDLLSKRGEKIHIVTTKAQKLREESSSYIREGIRLRQKIRMRRVQYIIIISVSLLLMGYIMSVIVCGGFTWKDCRN